MPNRLKLPTFDGKHGFPNCWSNQNLEQTSIISLPRTSHGKQGLTHLTLKRFFLSIFLKYPVVQSVCIRSRKKMEIKFILACVTQKSFAQKGCLKRQQDLSRFSYCKFDFFKIIERLDDDNGNLKKKTSYLVQLFIDLYYRPTTSKNAKNLVKIGNRFSKKLTEKYFSDQKTSESPAMPNNPKLQKPLLKTLT